MIKDCPKRNIKFIQPKNQENSIEKADIKDALMKTEVKVIGDLEEVTEEDIKINQEILVKEVLMKRKKGEDMEVEEEIAKATRGKKIFISDAEKTARAVVVEAAETKSSTDKEAPAQADDLNTSSFFILS